MARGDTTFNWNSTTATVNVGEAITVTSTVASTVGLSYTVADPSIATASTQNYTSWTITGVSAGTTTVTVNGASSGSTVLTVTVNQADDESYLNKRGLTHFWNNIDTLKQDKLTAGAGISITGNTISASGVTSFNGLTGAVTYTAPVTSVNGSTGAVTGLQTTSNLVTSVSSSSTNSQYPSAKLFYDTVGNVETILQTLNNGGGAQ